MDPDFYSQEETTPMVLADPLNPGAYLPAAYQCHVEYRDKGRLYLLPTLTTTREKQEAWVTAKTMARALEDEYPS